jgi:anti-sigma-K factor RskA
MAGPQDQPDEATMDLLIKQVIEGLSPAEERALDVLDSELASGLARDLERAAAAIALAGTPATDSLPQGLRDRIEAQARDFFASPSGAASQSGATPRAGATSPPGATPPANAAPNVVELKPSAAARSARPAARAGAAGWWAAAACLVLAAVGWLRTPVAPPVAGVPTQRPGLGPPMPVPPNPVPPVGPAMTEIPPPTAPEERAAMLSHPDALKVSLGVTKDPAAAGASGDVVWDPVKQRGFLRFAGLKPNDPRRHQYQLWIFDGERDQRYPIDGGVFNVPEDASEVVVPIRAALLVHDAKAFAVTVEKPGGVVVSDRSRVVALGKAS